MINYISSFNTNKNKPVFGAKPIPVDVANKIKLKLLNPKVKTVDIYCHVSPDEDTISSMKVMSNWLNKYKKRVSICVNLKEAKNLYFKSSKYNIKKDGRKADMSLILDFNGEERLPKHYLKTFKKNKEDKIIGFDHHAKTDTLIQGDLYIDNTAKSCCGTIYRFFESIGEKLKKKDLKSLYCGMLSDYSKSKLVEISEAKLTKLPALKEDKNSGEVLEKIEAGLSEKEKSKIYKHLDVMSNLTQREKEFNKKILDSIQVTPNGKLAYVIIPANDKQWRLLGMDNTRTSTIIGDLRKKLLDPDLQSGFSLKQKESIQNINGAIVFYRVNDKTESAYQMSITTKDNYAKKLINYIKKNLNPTLDAGGHPNRMGGRVHSIEEQSIKEFINNFLVAAEKVN